MRASIIVPDQTVVIDGYGIKGLDLSSLDAEIRAVQWNETSGHIELYDGTNETLESSGMYQSIWDEHAAAKYQIENPTYTVTEIKERNKLKAKIEQNTRLQELIKNDKRKEIGLPPVMTNADEETIKDYVKALQADVESPSEDEAYNPPLPPSVTPPAIKSLVVLVAREEGWQGNLGFRIVLKAADESYTPTNLALSVYLQPECNDYLYTTGAFQYDAENDEYYAVCPPGQEPGDSIVYMGLLYGSAPLACWTLKTGEMQKKIYAYEEA